MGFKNRVLCQLDVIVYKLLDIERVLSSPRTEVTTMPVDSDALRERLQTAYDATGDALDMLDAQTNMGGGDQPAARAAARDARAAAARPTTPRPADPQAPEGHGTPADKTAGRRGGQSAGGK